MKAHVWKVTSVLIGVGAVIGAVAGMASLIPVAVQQRLAPTPDDGLVGPLSSWLGLSGGLGAATGAVVGPLLGLALLRSAPLWRVVLEPATGAIAGGMLGWLVVRDDGLLQLFGSQALVWCSALGALLAALSLKWRYRFAIAASEGQLAVQSGAITGTESAPARHLPPAI